jgi:hypothetical protein
VVDSLLQHLCFQLDPVYRAFAQVRLVSLHPLVILDHCSVLCCKRDGFPLIFENRLKPAWYQMPTLKNVMVFTCIKRQRLCALRRVMLSHWVVSPLTFDLSSENGKGWTAGSTTSHGCCSATDFFQSCGPWCSSGSSLETLFRGWRWRLRTRRRRVTGSRLWTA